MAVVRCTECSKKLKVADASVGKKVKCSCGNIFIAEVEEEAPAPAPVVKKSAGVVAPEKVFVACTECEAKLKVATTSLGKKMKCPKCASVFLAAIEDEAPAPPPPLKKNGKFAPPKPALDDEDEAPKPKPKAKGKPAKADDDDMDAFFSFAQEDAAKVNQADDDDDAFAGGADDEDDDMPKPKAKAGKGRAKPPRPRDEDDEDDEWAPRKKAKSSREETPAPVYPRRVILSAAVLFLVVLYIGFFVGVYLKVIDLGITKPPAIVLRPNLKKNDPKKSDTIEYAYPTGAKERFELRQTEEKKWLEEYRKSVRVDIPYVVHSFSSPGARIVGIAFSPTEPLLASVAQDEETDGIKLWDLQNPKEQRSIPVKIKSHRPRLIFSPNGQSLTLISDGDKMLKVWKVADGKEELAVALTKTPQSAAFSADGKRLVLIAREPLEEPDVTIWDTATWKEIKPKTEFKTDKFAQYVFAPDGDRLAEIHLLGKIVLRDLFTGAEKEIVGKDLSQGNADASADGKSLAIGASDPKVVGASVLEIISLETGDIVPLVNEKQRIDRVQYSPDGKFVLFEVLSQFKLIEIESKKARWEQSDATDALAFSPGGALVARPGMGSIHLLAFDEMIGDKKVDNDKKTEEKKKEDDKKTEEKKNDDDKKKEEKKTEEKKKDDTAKGDEAAEKAIKALGGSVVRDDQQAGKPIVEVGLFSEKITDADLKWLLGLKQVKKVSLGGTAVTGAGLAELVNLPSLEHLDLAFAKIDDSAMKEVGALKQLKYLSVLNTKVTDVGLKELAGLTELRHFVVGQNKITDAALKELLPAFKHLQKLEMGNCGAGDGSMKAVAGLEDLEVLHVFGTDVSDAGLKEIAGLAKLQELRLSFKITDKGLKDLAELKNLRIVSLFATNVTVAGIKELAALPHLKQLILGGTQMNDASMKEFAAFAELENLDLSGTPLTDAGIKELTNVKKLKFLNLSQTKVSDEGLKELAKLESLQTLLLFNTQVTAAAITELRKSLPKCNVSK